VPWHNPVLLASRSHARSGVNGRFDFGGARATASRSSRASASPIEEAPNAFDEAMAFLRKAWARTNDRFSHTANPLHFDNIIIERAPCSSRILRLWMGARQLRVDQA